MKSGTKLGKTLIALYLAIIVATIILAAGFRISVVIEGEYFSKEEVALYLYSFKRLPSNFISITEVENEELRPENLSLLIGGDAFEYSGEITKHTKNQNLFQADIYDIYNNSLSRGEMRLVYTADFTEVFFTSDNFKSFSALKLKDINNLSDGLWITFGVLMGLFVASVVVCYNMERLSTWKNDFQQVFGAIYIFIISIFMVPMYFIFRVLRALKTIILGQ